LSNKNSRYLCSLFKIGFMGSHCVGKTKYVKMLYKWFIEKGNYNEDEIAYIYEIVRDCPFEVNERTSLKAQKWILEKQMEREKYFFELNKRIIITDRTVVDNFAYLLYAKRVSAKDITVKDVGLYAREVDFWLKVHSYNIIFYIRVPNRLEENDEEIEDDGFRSLNKSFQLEIDKIIETILIDRFNLSVINNEVKEYRMMNNIYMIYVDYGNIELGFKKILEVIMKYKEDDII